MGWLSIRFVRERPYTDSTVGMIIRRWILIVLACIMISGPSIVQRTTTRAINATDVFIAVDVTGSMAVRDATYGSSTQITSYSRRTRCSTRYCRTVSRRSIFYTELWRQCHG